MAAALTLAALGTFLHYRVQSSLRAQAQAGLEVQLDSLAQVPRDGRAAAVASLTGESFGQLLTDDGALLATSPQLAAPLVSPADLPAASGGTSLVRSLRLTREQEPEPALILARRAGDGILVVGTSLESVEDAADGIRTQLLVGGPLALLLAAGLGYVVAGAALRPVERMRERAATISATSVDDRLPLPRTQDELHRLGSTLNAMLDRLDEALQRERRVVADAGHELRTPLALLRTELDLALARPRSIEELRAALASASDEVDRLSRLSNDLLVLASSDASARRSDRVSIARLVDRVAARFTGAAAELDRRIDVLPDSTPPVNRPVAGPVDEPVVVGDEDQLDRVLSNLVDTALQHGQGDVRLGVHVEADRVMVTVGDDGPALPSDRAAELFTPFVRGNPARTEPHRGLGLAIVRAIVEAHGGRVRFADTPGTTVVVDLPRGH